jgi:hypothetical protein
MIGRLSGHGRAVDMLVPGAIDLLTLISPGITSTENLP